VFNRQSIRAKAVVSVGIVLLPEFREEVIYYLGHKVDTTIPCSFHSLEFYIYYANHYSLSQITIHYSLFIHLISTYLA
jgi:hypothetical protein